MRLAGSESWQMTIDIPEILQFAAYVAQREGFADTGDGKPPYLGQSEWREWWDLLLAQIREPAGLAVDAPDFQSLTAKPRLRELCQRHWAEFIREWSKVKPQLIQLQMAQLGALKLHDIVRDAERSMHRRARPFSLRIDFVCWPRYDPNDQMYRGWPQDYRRLAAEDHLVLGISYLETARLDDLRAIVQMQVARLV